MSLSSIVLLFMAMLMAALLLEPLARLLRLPLSAALVAGGFAGSQLMVGSGLDTGLRWYHFHDLVFYVFLPALIFESAISLNGRLLLRNLAPIILLALPLLLLSAGITAALLYLGIGHPQGFPWITALVCGTLLAATDPVAVTELAKRLPLPQRLLTLMEGESLLNDATTVVLFMLLLGSTAASSPAASWQTASLEFGRLALGGLAVGLFTGALAGWLIRWLNQAVIISLLTAYAAYLLAETQFGVSGVMASLASGLWLGRLLQKKNDDYARLIGDWWANLGWIANSSLFLLAGATITLAMFEARWLAMLIGIGAALSTRVLAVWLVAGLVAVTPRQQAISNAYRLLMAFGGLRGAVTLALALSLPLELEGWWTAQSIAYGVVLFSLFIQAPLIEPLVKRLNNRQTL